MEDNKTLNDKTNKIKEIDVVAALMKVLREPKTLLAFFIGFSLLGVVVALNQEKMYTTNVVLAPEVSSGLGMTESLSDIASMVGIDMKSGSNSMDAIYPQIYPDIFASSDFIVGLFNVKVKPKKGKAKTYYDHLTKDGKIPFWVYPQMWLKKLITPKDTARNDIVNPGHLTRKQFEVCKTIRNSVLCLVDKKTNVITISVTDFDPMVSAQMADVILKRLQDYITDYRTKKARNDLKYTQELYAEAKAKYVKARRAYGAYGDANTDVILPSSRLEMEDKENDMQMLYNTYNQLTQQLQIAQAKVQENTPAFTVIQAASVPILSSSTPRSFIVLGFAFVGCVADALWVLIIRSLVQRRKKAKQAVE